MYHYALMKYTYSPKEFGSLVGKTTKTLQRWDREGILIAHRSVTNRRYYSHDQYLQATRQKGIKRKIVTYFRVSSAGQKKDLSSQKDAVESFYCPLYTVFQVAFMDYVNTRKKSSH